VLAAGAVAILVGAAIWIFITPTDQMVTLTALVSALVLIWTEYMLPPSTSGLTPRPTILLIFFALSAGAYPHACTLAAITFVIRWRHWRQWDVRDFVLATSLYVWSVGGGALTAYVIGRHLSHDVPGDLRPLVTALVASLAFLAANLCLVSVARTLSDEVSLWRRLSARTLPFAGQHVLYGLTSGGAMALCLRFLSPDEGLVTIGVAGFVGVIYATGVARHQRSSDAALLHLGLLAAAHEPDTKEHMRRVSRYSMAIADATGLSESRIERIGFAAQLHDIGKLMVPASIITKPGKLTVAERAEMQTHTTKGRTLLSILLALSDARDVAASHHERWDGEGYPDGLVGEDIPLAARIVALADSYDAMTSNRSYRAALSPEEAAKELRAASGAQFDPTLTRVFLTVLSEAKEADFATRPVPVCRRVAVY
jgi:HD-GYP domain-containing protein (c-di-GMP phosphodiesterase class II)